MSGLTYYAHKWIGDQVIARARWMSLHTDDPTDVGSAAAEVSTIGTNYGRIDMAGKMSKIDLASGRATLIGDVSVGPPPLGVDWGLITHAGFWDAETGGNMLMSGPLQTAQDITSGKQFQLLPGQFSIGKTP